MRRTLFVVLVFVFVNPVIAAKPQALHIPTDSKAKYTVLSVNKSGRNGAIIVTRRVGSSGTSYAKRLVDCKASKFKYLGSSDTLAGLKKSKPSPRMSSLINGSISYHVSKFACRAVRR